MSDIKEFIKDVEVKTDFTLPLLFHILNRIHKLETATNGVVALQFSEHPQGLGMVVRIYLPQSGKEFSYPDCILPQELIKRNEERQRVDILFDAIHEALEKVQPVSSTSGGLIHH